MEFKGSYDLHGSKSEVWDILNSAESLQRIIPGCTSVQASDDTTFQAKIVTRVGPLKVNFTGTANYVDLNPHDGFTIKGKGEGGPAGFVKGSVKITMESPESGVTKLSYVAKTSLGGKLASLGSRLLEAISRRNIDHFFTSLQHELTGDVEQPGALLSDTRTTATAGQSRNSYLPLLNTIIFAAIAVALWVIALK